MESIAFLPYSHIEESCDSLIDVLKMKYSSCWDDLAWVATEKVHGTNLQVITDGANIACASRNELLSESDSFHNYQAVKQKYIDEFFHVFRICRERFSHLEGNVRIFGELFGGIYGKKSKKIAPVQIEIHYMHEVDFYCFDIAIGSTYLSFDDMVQIVEEVGFPFYSFVLREDTLDNLLHSEVRFAPVIPARRGFDAIENNFAEGYVVRPRRDPSSMDCIDRETNVFELRFKLKNDNITQGVNPINIVNMETQSDPKLDSVYNKLLSSINVHRVSSVLAKYTADDLKSNNYSKLSTFVITDAFDELMRKDHDFVEKCGELSTKETRNVRSKLIPKVIPYIRCNFLMQDIASSV